LIAAAADLAAWTGKDLPSAMKFIALDHRSRPPCGYSRKPTSP
jgi:hypothetical protein